jgi:hypothetical protein
MKDLTVINTVTYQTYLEVTMKLTFCEYEPRRPVSEEVEDLYIKKIRK